MRIGVDLRVLQVGHQYRGIGEVAKRVLNEAFALAVKDPTPPLFIFYQYEDKIEPKNYLELPEHLAYEEVSVGKRPQPGDGRSLSQKLYNKWQTWYGNPLPQASDCDVLLQFDYSLGVPVHPRTLLVKHDIIPYVFWKDYFTSPWIHFRNKAARTTIRTMTHNYEYKRLLRRSVNNAWKIACVSGHTRDDLIKYLQVSPKKLFVTQLAASVKPLKSIESMTADAGGDKFPKKPFLLFVGAGDARRRVEDIVAAFNNLKADGLDIQLVLVGENFQSPEKIPNLVVRQAVLESSYQDDILTMGYVDDTTKQLLYKKAIAFIFATAYEGFGIPVLESMLFRCPVIAYANSSIPEVGGDHVFYADGWEEIVTQTQRIMALSPEKKQKLIAHAYEHAQGFSYQKTGAVIYKALQQAK